MTHKSEDAMTPNTASARAAALAGAAPVPAERTVLASLALCMLLPSLGNSIANVALPSLATGFAAPFQSVQWVVIAYLLATTTLVVGAGRLGDLAGRRRILLAGIGAFTLGSLLCGAAGSLETLIAARAVQGVGAAALMALSMALVGQVVPKERIGRAVGLLGTTSAVGTAMGPSLGGVLIAAFGWPAVFWINVPLAAVAGVLVWRCVPADAPRSTASAPRFDALGAVVLAVALASYALAMTLGRGDFGALNLALLGVAAAGLAAFVAVESRAASPLLRLSRLRDPVLASGLAMGAIVSTVMMSTLVIGPFWFSHALGFTPAAVGLAMSVGPCVAAMGGVPAGRLVDRIGGRRATFVGLAGIAIGSLAIAMLPLSTGLFGYLIPLVVLTANYALFQAANNTVVMTGVPADQRGVVSGLINLSRNLGLMTGASAMGAVFAFAVSTRNAPAGDAAATDFGMRMSFATAFALVAVALAIGAVVRGRRG